MTTLLNQVLKRSLQIDGREYVATLTPESLKLTLKGKRKGIELKWAELVGGEAALAVALHASIGAIDLPKTPVKPQQRRKTPKRARR